MMKNDESCPLRLMSVWAGKDLARWKKLTGRRLVHFKLGECLVDDVRANPAGEVRFILVFPNEGAKRREFDASRLIYFFDNDPYQDLWESSDLSNALEQLRQNEAEAHKRLQADLERRRQREIAIQHEQDERHLAWARKQEEISQEENRKRYLAKQAVAPYCEGPLGVSSGIARLSEQMLLRCSCEEIQSAREAFRLMSNPVNAEQMADSLELCSYDLLAALWMYRHWRISKSSKSLVAACKLARRCDAQIAYGMSRIQPDRAIHELGREDGIALLTIRSAAMCDLREWMKAEKLCEKILLLKPKDPSALRVLGRVRLNQDRSEEAAQLISSALHLETSQGRQALVFDLLEYERIDRVAAGAQLVLADPSKFGWLKDVWDDEPFL